jgi:hypothetical protein
MITCRVASAFLSRRVLPGVKVRLTDATFTMNDRFAVNGCEWSCEEILAPSVAIER